MQEKRADIGRRLDEDTECQGKCRKTNTSCNSQAALIYEAEMP